jgi:hypothetical protein
MKTEAPSNPLLECARYHEQFAEGVMAPCFRNETERSKAWSRRTADKHLEWAKACRTVASSSAPVKPPAVGLSKIPADVLWSLRWRRLVWHFWRPL